MTLVSYIFKPSHGPEIARKVITAFVNEWLLFEEHGFYLYWHERPRDLPEGYVEFSIETDQGIMENFTETCFSEEHVDSKHLTDDLFVLLGQHFWHETDDGEKVYTLEDRELMEVVMALAEDDTRVISSGADTYGWVGYQTMSGGWKVEKIETAQFLLDAPIKKEGKSLQKQLTLPLR